MNTIRKFAGLLALAFALVVAGCGGGGGSASSGLSFFVTDDLNAGYSGVWVTLKKVELLNASGATIVFDDPVGRVINVRQLNSGGENRFALLGDDRVANGTYTGVRVTLGAQVALFPTGQSTGQLRTFDGLDGSGNKVLTANFVAPRALPDGDDNIVIDFKLEDWTENGTSVQNAQIAVGSNSGLDDPTRHESDDFEGTISALKGTSPDLSFTLNLRHGMTLNVRTDASTAVFNDDGSPNPTLANGKRVQVRGVFSPTEKVFLASSVKVKVGEEDEEEVKGPTFDVNAGDGTFFVSIHEAEGFLPETDSIKVQTDASATRFFSHGGIALTQAEFFAILAARPGVPVEAEGTVSGSGENQVLTAKKVKIEDDEDEDDEDEARGVVLSKDLVARSFVLSLTRWEGFAGSVGMQVSVTTDGSTTFRGNDDEPLTSEQFFNLLTVGEEAKAKGAFSGGVLQARRAELEGDDPHEAKGMVTNVDAGAFAFDIVLASWEGFNGSFGMAVHVTTSPSTTFRDDDGNSMTREAFFAALSGGSVVEVEGTFNSGTSTFSATKAKFDD